MKEKQLSNFHQLVNGYRTVSLIGEITMETCARLGEDLLACQIQSASEPIKLIIISPGGDSDAALAICDLMNHILTAPVHAIAVGRCSSAATFIFLQCPVRMATPHTRFVIHSSTISGIKFTMNQMTENNLKDLLKETTDFATRVNRLYEQKLRLQPAGIRELLARGDGEFNNSLSAEEALKIGLITEIATGKVGIFPANP